MSKVKYHQLAERLVKAVERDMEHAIGPYGRTWLQVIIARELEQAEKDQIPQRDPNKSYEL